RLNLVQIYYSIVGEIAEIYVLDERNSLFRQRLFCVSEQSLLVPMHRFFTALQYRRFASESINPAEFELPYQVEYYRLHSNNNQQITAAERINPRWPEQDSFFSVQAIYGSSGQLTLYCNQREFTELEYGANLYEEVATAILSVRHTGERYPCYITDLDLSQQMAEQELQTSRFLKKKAELELRIN